VATVEVFVDDAVRGRLPGRCVVTGEPTQHFVREDVPIGSGLGALWLLVFLGPIGWLILLLVALTRRRPILTVRLPMSEAPFGKLQSTRRALLIGGSMLVGGAAGVLVSAMLDLGTTAFAVLGLVALVGLVVSVVARVSLAFQEVGVSLDASRRWVTLKYVSTEFADAVRAQEVPR